MKVKINSINTLLNAGDDLAEYFKKHKHFTMELYTKRSLPANALQHKWYWAIARQTGHTEKYIKSYCKYHFAIPIYFRRNDEESNTLREFMRGQNWDMWAAKWGVSVEQAKMEIVGTQRVTSLFKKHESTEYMEAIENHFKSDGIIFPTKDDDD